MASTASVNSCTMSAQILANTDAGADSPTSTSRRMTSSERRPRKRPKRARRRCVLRLWRQRSVRQRSATRCRRRVALAQRHQRSATSAHSHSGAPTTLRYIPPRHGRLAPASLPMHPRFKKAREREVEEMTARLQELILSQKMASEEKLSGTVRKR